MSDHPDHPTQLVTAPDGSLVPIDTGIVELIFLLWAASIATVQSCESWKAGMAWVQFVSAEDAAAFIAIVGSSEDDAGGVYDRLTHWDVIAPRAEPGDGFWRYAAAPRVAADGRWTFTMSVEFPVSDLAEVTRRLQAHLGGAS